MSHYLLTDFIRNDSHPLPDVMAQLIKMAVRCAEDLELDLTKLRVDSLSLYAAIVRSCRDSFGYQRVGKLINERFDSLSVGLSVGKKEALEVLKNDLLDELKNSGIRISSDNPYIHKVCAFLLYHLTISKPFYIDGEVEDAPPGEKKAYFNANVCIYIINVVLAAYKLWLPPSKDLLRDLTYRLLSRSAIEAIMRSSLKDFT